MKILRSTTAITKLAFAVAFLSLITLAGVRFVQAAWTPPTSAPPGGNVAAPLNVSGVSQTKQGSLTIGGDYLNISGGYLGLGTGDIFLMTDDRGIFWADAPNTDKPHIESAGSVLYLSPGVPDVAGSRTEIQGDVNISTLLGGAVPNPGSLTIENSENGRSLAFSMETLATGVDIKTPTSKLIFNYDISQNIHFGGGANPKVKLCLNDETEANCVDDWSDVGGVGGSGTAWKIPRWDTPTTLTDSVIHQLDDGSNNHFVGINNITPTAVLTLGPVGGGQLMTDIDLNPFPNYLWRIRAVGSIGTLQDKRFYIGPEGDGAGSEALAINRLGETGLGVGTEMPTAMLHVKGRANGSNMSAGLINSTGVDVAQSGGQTYFDMFGPGDYITASGQTRVINTVLTPTSLTTTVAFAPPIANQPYSIVPTIARFADNTGTTKLIINPEGRIGIGTIDPQQVLHVIGNARISGLTCNGLLNGGKVTTNANGDLICGDDTGGGGGGDTYMVKTDGTDTANFLNSELTAGANITLTPVNVGGDLKLQIAASGSGSNLWEAGASANTINPINETTDKVAIGHNSIGDSTQLSVKTATANSAIYAEQAGSGYSGYFSGRTVVMSGNLGVGDATPASSLTVGNGDLFQVDSAGNLIRVRNITYSWPNAQGGASTYLRNDGSGNLSWVTLSGGSDNYTVKTNGTDTDNYLATELVAGTNVSIDTTTVGGDLRTRINFSGGSGLPAGSSGQTLRHDGSNWVANSMLFNNGSQVSVGVTDPANRFEVGQNLGGYMALRRDDADNDINAGDDLGALYFTGDHGAVADIIGAQIKAKADDNWALNAYPTKLSFFTRSATAEVERLTLDGLGRVGINTPAPQRELHVTGNVRVSGLVCNGFVNGGKVTSNASGDLICGDDVGGGGGFISGSGTVNRISKFTAATAIGDSVIYETSGGNIGIGAAPGGSYKLDVSGPIFTNADNDLAIGNIAGVNRLYTNASNTLIYLSSGNGYGNAQFGKTRLGSYFNSDWDSSSNNVGWYWNAAYNGTGYDYINPAAWGGTASRLAGTGNYLEYSQASGGANPITWNKRFSVNSSGVFDIGNRLSFDPSTASPDRANILIGDGTGWKLNITRYDATKLVTFTDTGNLGVGDSSPASALTVGNGDLFQVNSSGNIVKINNVTYSWPAAQGGANTVLSNNGSGALSWATMTSLPAGSSNQMLRHNGTTWTADSTIINTGSKIGIANTAPGGTDGLLAIASSATPYNANHTLTSYNNSTTNYNALSGFKSGANVRGSGVYGGLVAGSTCAGASVCAGVYGSDGGAGYPVLNGWFAGYFNGDVNVADQLNVTGAITTPSATISSWLKINYGSIATGKVLVSDAVGVGYWGDPSNSSNKVPRQMSGGPTAWIAPGGDTGEINISSLGCTEWPNIQAYSANETFPDRWNTSYDGTGWTGGADIGYMLDYVDLDSFVIHNHYQTKRFRWAAICR